jgi:hypothetical protein
MQSQPPTHKAGSGAHRHASISLSWHRVGLHSCSHCLTNSHRTQGLDRLHAWIHAGMPTHGHTYSPVHKSTTQDCADNNKHTATSWPGLLLAARGKDVWHHRSTQYSTLRCGNTPRLASCRWLRAESGAKGSAPYGRFCTPSLWTTVQQSNYRSLSYNLGPGHICNTVTTPDNSQLHGCTPHDTRAHPYTATTQLQPGPSQAGVRISAHTLVRHMILDPESQT